jgi:hypothetical protein
MKRKKPSKPWRWALVGLVLWGLGASSAGAQEILQVSERDKAIFRARIKDIGQFIKHFNFEQDRVGDPVPPAIEDLKPEELEEYRKKGVFFITEEALANTQRFQAFAQQIADNKVKLDMYNAEWYAVVNCDAQYTSGAEASPQRVRLQLALQKRRFNGAVSWFITHAKMPFLDAGSGSRSTFLAPNLDGTNFMGLPNALQKAAKPQELAGGTARSRNAVDLFLHFLDQNRLKITKVSSFDYTFFDVEGWRFRVREFNEVDSEARNGLLIYELERLEQPGAGLISTDVLFPKQSRR